MDVRCLTVNRARCDLGEGGPLSSNAPLNCSLVIGTENILNVLLTLFWCSSCDVAAQQSVTVMTLYPYSYPVRMVLSTQQLVSKPQIAKFATPRRCKSSSKFVPAKLSNPCFPLTIASGAPSMGSASMGFSSELDFLRVWSGKGAKDSKKS
eukprot:CAMPEP_0198568742 /NCGR_PEP_ID=MMETSP1462-20131121/106876_1 /TAXON_ID=1333877 /ORGANISM="Brandtodinium nutriculum, Strain RCC3387" /LENGTH=150 /DNA_ID=CAMNT_0044299817 /DNA_START=75 /DNA_END=523 /DNA_ORIENTATION=-